MRWEPRGEDWLGQSSAGLWCPSGAQRGAPSGGEVLVVMQMICANSAASSPGASRCAVSADSPLSIQGGNALKKKTLGNDGLSVNKDWNVPQHKSFPLAMQQELTRCLQPLQVSSVTINYLGNAITK